MHPAQYLRRKQAAEYLKQRYGIGSEKSLAKLATLGGGPEIVYFSRFPLYIHEKLDEWAQSKLSAPVSSTSQKPRSNPEAA